MVVYGDGTQTRDFVFIEDLCKGIIQALGTENPGVYQLGSGTPTSVNELISLVRQTVGDKYAFNVVYQPPRQGEIAHTWTDITRARAKLGYHPTMELAEGLERTWKWFLDNYRE